MNYKRSLPISGRLGWFPLVVLTAGAVCLRGSVPPWGFMWIVSIAIFAGFKWWTWWRAFFSRADTTACRSFIYLCLWPGMDARRFLALGKRIPTPTLAEWIWAIAKTLFGAILVWGVARFAGEGLLAGWIGMVGFIFLLHFGLFAMLSFFWQRAGIDAPPLMHCPIIADSLGDFWGRRWNAGFRDIVFGLMFIPLARRLGTTGAAMATFLISGLIHEVVITLPLGEDFGWPTFYFVLQGAALLLERSFGFAGGWCGHVFALAVVTLPIFALFPPSFVVGVMVPFLQFIQALP